MLLNQHSRGEYSQIGKVRLQSKWEEKTHNIIMLLNVIALARLLSTSDRMKTKNRTYSHLIVLRIITQCQYQ